MPNFIIPGGWTLGNGWSLQSYSSVITDNLVMNLDAAILSDNPSTWTDSVSNLTFTLYGSPTYSSANGGVLQFSPGSGQYAQSGNQSFGTLTTFTTEAWHYYTGTNTGTDPCIIVEVYPGSNNKINFILGTGTTAGIQAGYYDGAFRITSAYTPTAGNWYHLVGTYDGANIKLYVNNSLVYTTAISTTPTSSTGGIRLMRRWDNAEYWGGYLGIVRIYSTALTATQVATNYNADKTRFGLT